MTKWVRHFRDGHAGERDLLGGKGANLAEMTRIGLPVPPGFTITTDAFRAFQRSGAEPGDLWSEVRSAMVEVEHALDRQFGNPDCPLLLSIRSGARDSMPGMMDTILDVGLNAETVDGLALMAGDRFAWDSWRRLIQMYGRVVLGVDGEEFEHALSAARLRAGVEHDHELDLESLQHLVEEFRGIVARTGVTFPDDPWEQLRGAVLAVFRSWDSPRAVAYRRATGLGSDGGTAVNIQAMVFGNIGEGSASGVAFTRNPNTGEPGMFGEYLPNAQGEDVVSGVRTPMSIELMTGDPAFRRAHADLLSVGDLLEQHFTDMQDLEFTIERGTLWMLQTRTGKRTATAAVRMAVEMVREGMIDEATAVGRVKPTEIHALLHPQIDPAFQREVIARGMPASPGAATGAAIFCPDRARELGAQGEAVILVRNETAAEDFPGMERSRGILTARGGMTSHAAVVARGMGLPAVTGCGVLEIDAQKGSFRVGDTVVREGDRITIDGASGEVMLGDAPMTDAGLDDRARLLLHWADGIRVLGVRANADTPVDAARARTLGAKGIGLCRTEHMFFAPDRIDVMRRMILAQSDAERCRALDELEAFQTTDFAEIFRAMDGLPVTVRLLDPPLHEFLPDVDDLDDLAGQLGVDVASLSDRVEALHEVNPMLGLRGVRLGMTFPEVTRMQVRAILTAATLVARDGVTVLPEIMVPLVSTPSELQRQRELIDRTAAELAERSGICIRYKVGTMIEVPRALLAGEIAEYADFFSFGTNDLTQMTFGLSRDDSARFLPSYVETGVLADDPFQVLDAQGVGQLVRLGATQGRSARPSLSIGVCGEHGGDPRSIAFCHEIGLDYVSCSPFRVPVARLAAAQAAIGN